MARQGGCRVRGGLWPAKGDLYVSKSAPRAVETGPWRQSRVEAEPQSRGDRAVEAEPRGGRAAEPWKRPDERPDERLDGRPEAGPWGQRGVGHRTSGGRAVDVGIGRRASAPGARRWITGVGLGAGPLRRQGRECSRGSSAAGPWRQGRGARAVKAEPRGEGGARHRASGTGAGRQAPSRIDIHVVPNNNRA